MAYDNGRGVPEDPAEAADWYGKSAEQVTVDAQINLSGMYITGRDIPKDYVQAYKLADIAAAASDATAVSNIALVAKIMSPAQIAEGRRQAAAWRAQKQRAPATSAG